MTSTALARPLPEPEHFDVIVVGSGSGNTILDERFAGKRCAIVEAGTFGGTCLNVGCIPTKMFVHPADLAREAAHLPALGIDATVGHVHWDRLRDRVFGRIDPISAGGRRWRADSEDVELVEGMARFVAPKVLRVGRRLLTAEQIVLANGSRPQRPAIPGLDDVESRLHTSDSIMRLARLPKSLVILGGGYIACEFAHVFTALGVKVTIIARSDLLLRREDRDIARLVTDQLSERATVRLRQRVSGLALTQHGIVVTSTDETGTEYEYEAEIGLLAMGRLPNADTLDCAAGGVAVNDAGYVVVDEHQRTSADGVWALGDVCSPSQLKHVANAEARTVQHNLLHPDALVATRHAHIPHAVFCEPQVASVGLTEEQCVAQGIPHVVGRQDFADVAFGWAMELPGGRTLAKVLVHAETGEILGAHLAGPTASSLLQPVVTAMAAGLDAAAFARGQYWIHPALSEVVENAVLKALPNPRG